MTRWPLFTCILVIIEGSLWNRLKCILYENSKPFFERFIAILQSTQNFPHFEKKGQLYSLNSWEVIDSKKCVWLNARSSSLRIPFGSQSFDESQTLLTSARPNIYPNFAVIQTILSDKTSPFGKIRNLRSIS